MMTLQMCNDGMEKVVQTRSTYTLSDDVYLNVVDGGFMFQGRRARRKGSSVLLGCGVYIVDIIRHLRILLGRSRDDWWLS